MSKLSDLLDKKPTPELQTSPVKLQPTIPPAAIEEEAPATSLHLDTKSNPLAAGLKTILKLPAAPAKPEPNKPLTIEDVMSHNVELSVDVEGRHAEGVSNLGNLDMSKLAGIYESNIQAVASALKIGQVGESLYKCMDFIDANLDKLEIEKLLMPEDIGLLVRALQQAHGVVIVKKTENKAKRTVTKAEEDALASKLSDLGFNLQP